jgi:hypothetical protein
MDGGAELDSLLDEYSDRLPLGPVESPTISVRTADDSGYNPLSLLLLQPRCIVAPSRVWPEDVHFICEVPHETVISGQSLRFECTLPGDKGELRVDC